MWEAHVLSSPSITLYFFLLDFLCIYKCVCGSTCLLCYFYSFSFSFPFFLLFSFLFESFINLDYMVHCTFSLKLSGCVSKCVCVWSGCVCVSFPMFLVCMWISEIHIIFPEDSCVCVCFVCCEVQPHNVYWNFPLKILIIVMFSQWYLFNFPLLTFPFLSGGIYNFTPTPQRSERGRKRGRERVWFERLESHKFIGITWCDFDFGFSVGMFFGNLRDEIWKSLYFRLHYTKQHLMDILNVWGHFWMQELMWIPKMWDERERWKIESVSE